MTSLRNSAVQLGERILLMYYGSPEDEASTCPECYSEISRDFFIETTNQHAHTSCAEITCNRCGYPMGMISSRLESEDSPALGFRFI